MILFAAANLLTKTETFLGTSSSCKKTKNILEVKENRWPYPDQIHLEFQGLCM